MKIPIVNLKGKHSKKNFLFKVIISIPSKANECKILANTLQQIITILNQSKFARRLISVGHVMLVPNVKYSLGRSNVISKTPLVKNSITQE